MFDSSIFISLEDTSSLSGSSSIGIDLCSWRECAEYSVLVLFCNNGKPLLIKQGCALIISSSPSGYLVIRYTPFLGTPSIKQLKWFESHQQHILDMVLDPLGEWLACACLDGTLYLLPVLSLAKKVQWKMHIYHHCQKSNEEPFYIPLKCACKNDHASKAIVSHVLIIFKVSTIVFVHENKSAIERSTGVWCTHLVYKYRSPLVE